MIKKILIFSAILAFIGFGIYKYAFKPQRNIATEKATFEIAADDFLQEFSAQDSIANLKYLDKTIFIYGKITTIDLKNNAIIVNDKIYVTFTEKLDQNLQVESPAKLKARYVGFDDLLEEYRMDQGTIIK